MTINLKLSAELLEIQTLALKSAKDSFNQLSAGMTELEACEMMNSYLKKNNVSKYFHHPFAWFDERTMFSNFSQPLPFLQKKTWGKMDLLKYRSELPHLGKEFLPTNKTLEVNTPVILDVAPMKNGIFADIGYSRMFGEDDYYQKMLIFLKGLREKLPSIITNEKIISKIYKAVDFEITKAGFHNCHQLYPLGVLGHKVGKFPKIKLPNFNIMGFEPEAFIFLFSQNMMAPFHYNKKTPYLSEQIDQPMSKGYWAIEPHIHNGTHGAKFEEILVYSEEKVQWLDKESLNLS